MTPGESLDGVARWLRSLALFEGVDDGELRALASRLRPVSLDPDQVLMREGEPAEWFALVVSGSVSVRAVDEAGFEVSYDAVGSGSIVGEIAMLRGSRRSATVVAGTPVQAVVGEADGFFDLLALPGVADRVIRTAAQRLAAQVSPVAAPTGDGGRCWLRPLVPGDRAELGEAIAALSVQARRMRFFTAGAVPPGVVDRLADIDYLNHFAWVAASTEDGHGIGVARFIRDPEDASVAEVAVAVAEDHRGRGLGSLLLGATAVAASVAGVHSLHATVLRDNRPMRALLDRLDARWDVVEPGVVGTTIDVERYIALLPEGLAATLVPLAQQTMSATVVPLTVLSEDAGPI